MSSPSTPLPSIDLSHLSKTPSLETLPTDDLPFIDLSDLSKTSSLETLPTEVRWEIIRHLRPVDFMALQLASRRCRDFLASSVPHAPSLQTLALSRQGVHNITANAIENASEDQLFEATSDFVVAHETPEQWVQHSSAANAARDCFCRACCKYPPQSDFLQDVTFYNGLGLASGRPAGKRCLRSSQNELQERKCTSCLLLWIHPREPYRGDCDIWYQGKKHFLCRVCKVPEPLRMERKLVRPARGHFGNYLSRVRVCLSCNSSKVANQVWETASRSRRASMDNLRRSSRLRLKIGN